ncbi:unnamed protein product [Lasius platythorax]|uniref:Uncharacterized protein n=1 Tax=Lasius platythorax TaxID=488582 RepID=A0AAV2P4F2_9HYME
MITCYICRLLRHKYQCFPIGIPSQGRGVTNRTECIINLVVLSLERPVISWKKQQGCNYDPYRQPLINVAFNV